MEFPAFPVFASSFFLYSGKGRNGSAIPGGVRRTSLPGSNPTATVAYVLTGPSRRGLPSGEQAAPEGSGQTNGNSRENPREMAGRFSCSLRCLTRNRHLSAGAGRGYFCVFCLHIVCKRSFCGDAQKFAWIFVHIFFNISSFFR